MQLSDGTSTHGARDDLIIGDGAAFDGAANEVSGEPIGAIAAVEAVGPFAGDSAAGAWR